MGYGVSFCFASVNKGAEGGLLTVCKAVMSAYSGQTQLVEKFFIKLPGGLVARQQEKLQ